MSKNKRQEILKIAEDMARKYGYNGFSYRDIAAKIGIKSASIHYHFPKKEDLVATIAKEYADRFVQALGSPKAVDEMDNPIARFEALFDKALRNERKMCLCGLLGAELDLLPPITADATRSFYQRLLHWLGEAYTGLGKSDEEAERLALGKLASLEGGMIVARVLGNHDILAKINK